PSLYAAGIEPVFVPTRAPSAGATNANGMRTGRIKNSVDVKMTVDCIEIAHSYPNIGTFVLVSGDSDFIHVVNTLRTMGKRVIVIGISWSTSRRLADQVDTLILYDVDVDPPAHAEPATPSVPAAEPVPDRASAGDLQDMIRAIEEIIQDERKAGGNPLLTSIKQRLTRRYPDFDEKKLGYSGFKRLMARVAQNGNIRLITAGLVDWAIMADEDIPEGATEATFSSPGSRPGRRRGRLPRSRQQEPQPSPGPELAGDEHKDDAALAVSTNGSRFGRDDDEQPLEHITEGSATPSSPFGDNKELSQAVQEAISGLGMPNEPDDGMLADRVSDLIFMANTLEHQEGVSHVAFNFLVSEICDALAQGLEAGHPDITQRWGQANSRTYISKMLRGLSDGDFFTKGNHSWRDETSGQNRRRRTFNLNHEHPLVQQIIDARWSNGGTNGDAEVSPPAASESPVDEPETLDDVDNGAGASVTNFPDYEDDDYESGKEAAEARAESGFISRLFRPRGSGPRSRR
ncbi:MAG: NYN domain-containing protein, partial [Chloroflexi bacterium]|nr:NYN domain-containing protein [Chloroflexota bacterium]